MTAPCWLFPATGENADFFGWHIILLLLIPVLLAIYLAGRRSLQRFDPRLEFGDDDFARFVLESPVPVVVHFHDPWHIGNRVMEANLKSLAIQLESKIPVGYLNIHEHPKTPRLYPDLKMPAISLFHRGEPLWVLEGVFYEEDVLDVLEQLAEAENMDLEALYSQTDLPWDDLRKGYS